MNILPFLVMIFAMLLLVMQGLFKYIKHPTLFDKHPWLWIVLVIILTFSIGIQL